MSSFLDKTLSFFGYQPKISGIDFMIYTGDKKTPAFKIDLDSFFGLKMAYDKCSIISTIIGKLALAMSNGKWWIVDKSDNDVSGREKSTANILERPNPLQSWTELMIQAETFRYVYGEVFFLFSIPVGFSAKDASCVYAINPELIEVKETGKMYSQNRIENIVEKYVLNINGYRQELEHGSVLHIRDVYQNLDFNPMDIRGKSRLLSLKYEIENIINAQEAVCSLNTDRGAQGLLINKNRDESGSIPMQKSQKENLQNEWNQYGMKKGQKKVIITDSDVDWKPISYNVRDLMLFEGIKCNSQDLI